MHNFDWDDIRFFLAAARTGSLSSASRALNSNQPTVGRRIAHLEKALGVQLFQRHALGLTLTEDGAHVLESAELMETGASALDRARHADITHMTGTVRVSAPEGLAVCVFAPSLSSLRDQYPHLDVVLNASAATADLARGEADIAVRLFRPTSGDIVTRRLQTMGFGLYASADYLAKGGHPASASREALAGHDVIAYGDQFQRHPENQWLESLAGDARIVLRSDSTLVRFGAAEQGLGVAVLPHIVAATSSHFHRIAPDAEGPSRTIWIAVHRDLRHVPRIRSVMDFLAGILGSVPH